MEGAAENRAAIAGGIALLIAVIIAVAALLDLGPFADEELSEAEFLARGDEICTEAHDRFLNIQRATPRTADDAATLTKELIAIAEEELHEIRDLEEPSTLSAPLHRYLEAREDGIERMREGLKAAEDEDAFGYGSAQSRVADTQPDRFGLAREVGFNECSRPLVSRDELERQAKPPSDSDPDAPPTVNNPPTGA
jgi:hypothetical protein